MCIRWPLPLARKSYGYLPLATSIVQHLLIEHVRPGHLPSHQFPGIAQLDAHRFEQWQQVKIAVFPAVLGYPHDGVG